MKETQPTLHKDQEDAFAGLEGPLSRSGKTVPVWPEREWERNGVTFTR